MMRIKISQQLKIAWFTALVSVLLIVFGLWSKDVGVLGNIVIISTFLIATPQLLLTYGRYKELKEMEDKFPSFLRDLTESIRSGMPFHKSIRTTSVLEYGSLTKEIRIMNNQLSWGMTVDKVLDKFAERVKKSKRLYTAIKIIKESYISGGDVVSILESVSDNATILGDSEKERMSLLNQYLVLMYAISFIFVIIVGAINKLLIPIFKIGGLTEQLVGLSNPCNTCREFTCHVCGMFEVTAEYIFQIDPSSIAAYYTSLFFLMALIQSLFSGLVAGQISEGSVTAGIKHSLILVGVTFGAFSILVRLGFLGV